MPTEPTTGNLSEVTAKVTTATKGKRPRVDIFDAIASGNRPDEKGLTASAFAKALADAGDVPEIDVHISSVGGGIPNGLAIYNTLRNHPARKRVVIDGLAASIASVIAMAGDDIEISNAALMMVHNPRNAFFGEAKGFIAQAETLGKWKEAMLSAYAERTGLGHEELSAMMDAETWLTAEQAVAKGFATKAVDRPPVRAEYDLSYCVSPPEAAWQLISSGSAEAISQEVESMPEEKTPEAGGVAPVASLALAEVDRYIGAFGAENGINWLRAGKSYEAALELHYKAEIDAAGVKVKAAQDAEAAALARADKAEKALAALGKGEPSAVASADPEKAKAKGRGLAGLIRGAGANATAVA
jgi:ATP-dependent protease ClpP protease subunit